MGNNPLFDCLKDIETKQDIADITDIVSEYEQSNGLYLDVERARKKVTTLRTSDPVINVMCAPKPTESIILLNQTTKEQLYNILTLIRTYLETKLLHDNQGQ